MKKVDKKIILIGSEGELGLKITEDIKGKIDIESVDVHNKKTLKGIKDCDSAIIATPPNSHSSYISKLIKLESVKEILCEKPLPEYVNIRTNSFFSFIGAKECPKVSIVDHYLYKKNIGHISDYFNENKSKIISIELFLCESKKESRDWMKNKKDYGGVTYDLAHHLIAIVGKLFGFNNLSRITNLDIRNIELFTGGTADKQIEFSFYFNEVSYRINVGKECSFNKKEVKFHLKGDEFKVFSIDDSVKYSKIIENMDSCLTLNEANNVNTLLNNVINLANVDARINILNSNNEEHSLELLELLKEEFKHRHSFYWSMYYRVFSYHLVIATSPFIIYYFLLENKLTNIDPNIIAFIIATVAFLVTIYLLKKTMKHLDEEEHRLTLPINRMREIYYSKFNINMYPGDKQSKSFREILNSEKTRKTGLSTGIMDKLIKYFSYALILIALLYFGGHILISTEMTMP